MNIKQASVFFSRLALFVIYFWFGLLKVVGQSPASEMVESLFGKTLAYVPFLSFGIFIVFFGLFEMLIGILFLVPGKERLALGLFFLHMIMVALPLFIIPSMWTVIFVPTLEGQYIIKNLALISCAITIASAILPKEPREVPQTSVLE
ncbi:MAG: hypothetical protein A2W58_03060 [Candidatus Zambryskibacteria bacterium RIFCSPHIGHO2_02_38_10.5]|uniref:DoxX family protein n=1 Tax=Candidatus Zambryskibacteria bacterium RIFCSPHIGHO2_02_38_10.5 TaxID=1802742 RepID=A0A1G2T9F3_9BACT|nr:MAG: hypothetical protein UT81_C0006G0024 [Parcubacteria group bacterium GW2011_GWA2_40_14]OHA93915.1 MAG: hypothetical protein A2W58_03060 [Candidatus Zambryskibacteria bacterium RIFCSPHIGHO2_02_38_10.5]